MADPLGSPRALRILEEFLGPLTVRDDGRVNLSRTQENQLARALASGDLPERVARNAGLTQADLNYITRFDATLSNAENRAALRPGTVTGAGGGTGAAGNPTGEGTTGTTTGGGAGGAPVGPDQATQQSARTMIRAILEPLGLGSLVDWTYNQFVDNFDPSNPLTTTMIVQQLESRPEFRDRFPAIFARRDAGLPGVTPAEVVEYESRARDVFRQAGLPVSFYDTPQELQDFLTRDVSVNELQSRVQDAFVAVSQAANDVRDVFAEWFGPNTNAALASYILDPEKALPILQKEVNAAFVGGAGREFGFDVGLRQSRDLAARGISGDQARGAFAQLDLARGFFTETVGEARLRDLDPLREGVQALLGGENPQGAQAAVRRRQSEREAAFTGGGRVAQSSRGFVGIA